ncbi:hypothetical protein RHECNPAF_2330024 [Rhizobium etli CNPAF512]|nr:hypothetical protein RHECNPAF_2330024 [Rhizobium etli CNPAF512]
MTRRRSTALSHPAGRKRKTRRPNPPERLGGLAVPDFRIIVHYSARKRAQGVDAPPGCGRARQKPINPPGSMSSMRCRPQRSGRVGRSG